MSCSTISVVLVYAARRVAKKRMLKEEKTWIAVVYENEPRRSKDESRKDELESRWWNDTNTR